MSNQQSQNLAPVSLESESVGSRFRSNLLPALGMGATAAAIGYGLKGMMGGDGLQSGRAMGMRVALQMTTLAGVGSFAFYQHLTREPRAQDE